MFMFRDGQMISAFMMSPVQIYSQRTGPRIMVPSSPTMLHTFTMLLLTMNVVLAEALQALLGNCIPIRHFPVGGMEIGLVAL